MYTNKRKDNDYSSTDSIKKVKKNYNSPTSLWNTVSSSTFKQEQLPNIPLPLSPSLPIPDPFPSGSVVTADMQVRAITKRWQPTKIINATVCKMKTPTIADCSYDCKIAAKTAKLPNKSRQPPPKNSPLIIENCEQPPLEAWLPHLCGIQMSRTFHLLIHLKYNSIKDLA